MSEFKAKSLLILGRQPSLGVAELESLFGPAHIQPLGEHALADIPAGEINFKRLGGTLKVAQLLTILPSTDWPSIYKFIANEIPKHMKFQPEGKFTLGISVYGLEVSLPKLNADLLSLKKIIRAAGRPARVVPNKALELNSAQVLHNNLTKKGGWELLVVRYKDQTYLAQTLFVQDIDAYAARDQARPKRDARVGMLPPKLAQILLNLATGAIEQQNTKSKQPKAVRVLDPFCGTGVVLQEALLMGYHVIGTDLEPRMVDYAKANLQWLVKAHPDLEGQVVIEPGDATSFQWPRFSCVASETYLGRPLASLPAPGELRKIIEDVNTITKKFLKNIGPQLRPGQKLALAVPAWKNGQNFLHLPLLENLTPLGYNRLSFVHAKNDELVYFREGQIVARELIILESKEK